LPYYKGSYSAGAEELPYQHHVRWRKVLEKIKQEEKRGELANAAQQHHDY
jgi:hypothetical protein